MTRTNASSSSSNSSFLADRLNLSRATTSPNLLQSLLDRFQDVFVRFVVTLREVPIVGIRGCQLAQDFPRSFLK